MLPIIKKFRKELHKNPELSGQEVNTANSIKAFITSHHPTKIIENIGGNGIAAIYDYGQGEKTIMVRCELDALPIEETNTFEHRSINEGVSHKCGHDGHIAIVAGLIFWLKEQTFSAGKVILLFQPAEETGEGGYQVLNDEQFKILKPDYIFALHNLPNEPLHSIITKTGSFSASVQSLSIHLTGKKTHASEPENGINPTLAIAEIIKAFSNFNNPNPNDDNFAILTPIYTNIGEKSYGIAPAKGAIHYTIRTWNEATMKKLEAKIQVTIKTVAQNHGLTFETNWFEQFPTTFNNDYCNEIIKKAAKINDLQVKESIFPLRFGEDFGWFSQYYPSAMFGLGAGLETPALHHVDYDFPEALLETGMNMFKTIILEFLK